MRDWWTKADGDRFMAQAKGFGAQYDTYEAVPGMHVNGQQTMGENIADLAGVLVALDAYHTSLQGKAAPVIDGLTGDQRFFLAFAQVWRTASERDDATRSQMASDPHSPSKFRVIGPLFRNVDAWVRDVQRDGRQVFPGARRTRADLVTVLGRTSNKGPHAEARSTRIRNSLARLRDPSHAFSCACPRSPRLRVSRASRDVRPCLS